MLLLIKLGKHFACLFWKHKFHLTLAASIIFIFCNIAHLRHERLIQSDQLRPLAFLVLLMEVMVKILSCVRTLQVTYTSV
jgi:hypothetical protein